MPSVSLDVVTVDSSKEQNQNTLRPEIKTHPWKKSSYFKDDIKMIIILISPFSINFS